MNDINHDEECFDAERIKDVHAKKHDGFIYLRCPYCKKLNSLPDSKIGFCICGKCKQIFNVK